MFVLLRSILEPLVCYPAIASRHTDSFVKNSSVLIPFHHHESFWFIIKNHFTAVAHSGAEEGRPKTFLY